MFLWKKKFLFVWKDGIPIKWKKGEKIPCGKNCMLCRCGKSNDKPFCDGTHMAIKFNGKETASNKKFLEQCETIEGHDLILKDAPAVLLCCEILS